MLGMPSASIKLRHFVMFWLLNVWHSLGARCEGSVFKPRAEQNAANSSLSNNSCGNVGHTPWFVITVSPSVPLQFVTEIHSNVFRDHQLINLAFSSKLSLYSSMEHVDEGHSVTWKLHFSCFHHYKFQQTLICWIRYFRFYPIYHFYHHHHHYYCYCLLFSSFPNY